MACVLNEIVVDSADPVALGQWWSKVLGWPLNVEEEHGIAWTSATGDHGSRPMITFVPVPDAKLVKNRVHLDVSPHGCDQDEELERLLGLGATRADVGQGPDVRWVVLEDPEGNEFCLLKTRVD